MIPISTTWKRLAEWDGIVFLIAEGMYSHEAVAGWFGSAEPESNTAGVTVPPNEE